MPSALHVTVLTVFATWYAQFHGDVLHEAELSCHRSGSVCHKLLSLQPTASSGLNMTHNGNVTMHIWECTSLLLQTAG